MRTFTRTKENVMRRLLIASLIATLLVSTDRLVHATAYTWNAGGGGDWTTEPTKWAPNGDPSTGDTVAIGDIGGPYTVTLNESRTISELSLTGSDPTLDLSNTLTLNGANSSFSGTGTIDLNSSFLSVGTDAFTYSGGTFNSTSGTLGFGRINGTTTVTWSAADPTDPMTYEIKPGSTVNVNRTAADWTLPANQTLHFRGNASTTSTFLTLDKDFNNNGTVDMGALTGDEYGYQFFDLPSNTFTNNVGGELNMFARTANVSLGTRYLRADVDNAGTVNVYTFLGQLGTTGKTVTNTGTINLESVTLSNLVSGFAIPQLTVFGDDFDNTGTVNINDGRLVVATETYDYQSGTLNFDPTGIGILALGRLHTSASVTTTVDWTGEPDISGPMTFEITPGSRVVVERDGPWTLPANQRLHFRGNVSTAATVLTLDQDFNNNGTVDMGAMTGDEYGYQYFDLPSNTFTNNAGGVLNMFVRTAALTLGVRQLRADVVNDGAINVYTFLGQLGTTGKTIENNGTISINPEILSNNNSMTGIPQLTVVGDSFINSATGRIEGDGKLVVTAVTNGVLTDGLINDGTLAPGLSAGTLDIFGNVTNSATSSLEIELGGLIAGDEHDQLNITEAFAIDGELIVTLIDGFGSPALTNGDTFTIATFASATGTFSNLDEEGRVTISDYDVDGRSFSFLVTIDPTSVILSDFEINPVPEPSSLALIGLGMFGLIGRARRKRRRS